MDFTQNDRLVFPEQRTPEALRGNSYVPAQREIEMWPVERLVPYEGNPRKNDDAVDRMAGSIQEFGVKIPVLARSDGQVVDGHLRLKADEALRRQLDDLLSQGDLTNGLVGQPVWEVVATAIEPASGTKLGPYEILGSLK